MEAMASQMFVPGRVSSSYTINVSRETNAASATCLTMLGRRSNMERNFLGIGWKAKNRRTSNGRVCPVCLNMRDAADLSFENGGT